MPKVGTLHGLGVSKLPRGSRPRFSPIPHSIEAASVLRTFRYSWLMPLAAATPLSAQDAPKPKPLSPLPKTKNQISIPFEKYTLPNGLTIILSQDKSAPTL